MRFVAAFAALWICCATLSLASVIPSYCGDDADYVYDNGRCFTLLGTQVRGVLQARARARANSCPRSSRGPRLAHNARLWERR